MKVSKEDIQNLTKAQLKQITDEVKKVLGLKTTGKTKDEIVNSLYDIHNNNKFNNKKLFGFDSKAHIILPERKINEKKTENKKIKKKLKEEEKEKQEAKIKKEKDDKNAEIKKRLKKVTADKIKKAEIARATTVYLETVRESREAEERLNEINRKIALRNKK
jgi:hypothetical protein|tara:strand:+ start:230 stop:715 length:486 start_codon:yes stop_codon:yes gene_type:complete